MLRTELSLFTVELHAVLDPLLDALASLGERLEGLELPGDRARLGFEPGRLAAALRVPAGELSELLARIDRERAAVFVFGPAKAGKSMLVDALAGVHALEATARPGYPCVRRVRPGPRQGGAEGLPAAGSTSLVRFDGSGSGAQEWAALELTLQRAQLELAQAARRARAAGELFEGARLAGTVRCIERELPAPALEQGALELVECPPIHGPLFSSYAEMLVGEAQGSRAAVFVLRVPQLWDEAVLDGIEELLEAFGDLLIVVNLDAGARDLTPGGEPRTGEELEEPLRLLESFEALTPCAALTRALQEGRARLLPLDLLAAARARLAEAASARPPAAAEASAELRDGAAPLRPALADLEAELALRLDRHEALATLVESGLRRAREALGEVAEALELPGLGGLPRALEELGAERTELERVERALLRLGGRAREAWEREPLFVELHARVSQALSRLAQELGRELVLGLVTAVDDWFTTSESVQQLLETRLAPRLALVQAELARRAEDALEAALADAQLPTRLSDEARRDLAGARTELAPLLATAALARGPLSLPPPPRLLEVEAIPVRARLGQRLALRSEDEVRRRLLGPAEAPDRALSGEEKLRRLGSDARAAIKASLEKRATLTLTEHARTLALRRSDSLLEAFTQTLARHVEERLHAQARPLEERVRGGAELKALLAAVRAAEQARGGAEQGLEALETPGTLVPRGRRATPEPGPAPLPARAEEPAEEEAGAVP